MEEPVSRGSISYIFEELISFGPIGVLGWFSLLIVMVMGGILLVMPPRSGRQVALVDIFAACLHIQMQVFILCVPLSLAGAAYLTLSPEPHVRDALSVPIYVSINFTIGGALLSLVSLRHRTIPTIEWLPAVSVMISLISLFAVWHLKLAALAGLSL